MMKFASQSERLHKLMCREALPFHKYRPFVLVGGHGYSVSKDKYSSTRTVLLHVRKLKTLIQATYICYSTTRSSDLELTNFEDRFRVTKVKMITRES